MLQSHCFISSLEQLRPQCLSLYYLQLMGEDIELMILIVANPSYNISIVANTLAVTWVGNGASGV